VKLDLLLENGLLVFPNQGTAPGSLGIRDGRIVALCAPGERPDASRVINCGGKWILPGLIDPHVHFGFGDPENDFRTESRSAALGGVTAVISFYRTKDFRESFDAEQARAESQSVIDFF
jgi:dihydropyrimidinase